MTRIPRVPAAALIGLFLTLTAGSAFASHRYVVANNNVPGTNTVTIYELSGDTLGASLVAVTTVPTGGAGIGGGYPANPTIVTARYPTPGCVFVGDAGSGDIAVMKPINQSPHLQLVGNFHSVDGDAATAGGLGLVVSGPGYFYASYTGNGSNIPPAIEVWYDSTGQCYLAYGDTRLVTAGINGGPIDSMALTPKGTFLIVGYTDGSVGSYLAGDGGLLLINQQMITGSGIGSGAYASGVAISRDGKWAIFADSSASNTTQVDVAPLANRGHLGRTTTYGGDGSLGNGLNATGIAFSPDNRFIYVVDSGSGQITTLAFDSTTGIVTYPNNCLTNLKDYNTNWSTASQVDVIGDAGTGTGLYVSEGFLTGESYIALLSVNSKTGCTTELPHSPFEDSNGGSLQSIATFKY